MGLRSFTAAAGRALAVLAVAGCSFEPSLCVQPVEWQDGYTRTMAVGGSLQMRAGQRDILDECDRPPPSRVVWSSSDPAVLHVDKAGMTRALALGTAHIVAQAARAEVRYEVVVVPSVARIEITPRDTSITVGDTVLFRAMAYGVDGAALPRVPLALHATEGVATYPGKGATPALREVYPATPTRTRRPNEIRAVGSHAAQGLVVASLIGRRDSAMVRLIWGRMPP